MTKSRLGRGEGGHHLRFAAAEGFSLKSEKVPSPFGAGSDFFENTTSQPSPPHTRCGNRHCRSHTAAHKLAQRSIAARAASNWRSSKASKQGRPGSTLAHQIAKAGPKPLFSTWPPTAPLRMSRQGPPTHPTHTSSLAASETPFSAPYSLRCPLSRAFHPKLEAKWSRVASGQLWRSDGQAWILG
eukprot:scaffold71455_cov95-Phaeocystis_antarctica.AAC.2